MRRIYRLRLAGVFVATLTLSACAFSSPALLGEDDIPVEVEATEITGASLDWESYFVPDCPEIESYAADLDQQTEFVEGVEYSAPSLTAWRFIQVVFVAENSGEAERLARGFSAARPCIGIEDLTTVTPMELESSFDSNLVGTAFRQVTDLSLLGKVEAVKTMVAIGKHLVYVDVYSFEMSGFGHGRLTELTKRAIN